MVKKKKKIVELFNLMIYLNNLVYDCLRSMQEGSEFIKVRSYVRQFHR